MISKLRLVEPGNIFRQVAGRKPDAELRARELAPGRFKDFWS
jgi:hypothetical protein